MFRIHTTCGLSLALAVATIAFAPGCGGSSRAYTPSTTSARQALDGALAAWQKGTKPDALASASPAVHPVDFQWQAGQALEAYQIVGEEPGEASECRFSVSLKLKKAPGELKTRYIVVGREPLWVYREEDYRRLLNMDNNPRPGPTRRR
jgi:hypothetical protein